VLPGADGFSHAGAAVGVLLCHGFTSTPQSLRPWANDLAAAGYSVELPLLPGHGTTWQELNRSTWQDWYGTVNISLADLRSRCSMVFLAGLSMGAPSCGSRSASRRYRGTGSREPGRQVGGPEASAVPLLRHVIPPPRDRQ
jgi:carboxylesterase